MDAARLAIQRRDFVAGYPATEGTIRWMGEIARRASVDARIRQRARQLTVGLPAFDHDAEIARVYEFVLGHVRYLRDPDGVEYMTDPVELDRQVDEGTAAEDCEGMILYALSLLASMGIPGLFAAHGFDSRLQRQFSHCSAVVINPRTKRATWFDPVGALEFPGSFGLGDTVYRAGAPLGLWDLDGNKVTMSEFRELFGSGGLGCVCRGGLGCSCDGGSLRAIALGDLDYEKLVRSVLDEGKKFAPLIGPWGLVASGVIQLGEYVYDAAGNLVGKALGPGGVPITTTGPAKLKPLPPAGRAVLRPSKPASPVAVGAGVGALVLLAKALF